MSLMTLLEFGDVGGLVSLTDVITSIVGDLPAETGEEPMIVRRDDGSWLLDGALDLDVALRTLDAESHWLSRSLASATSISTSRLIC